MTCPLSVTRPPEPLRGYSDWCQQCTDAAHWLWACRAARERLLEHQEGKQVFVVQGTVPGSPSDRGQLQPGDRLVGVLGSSPASVRCRVPHDCARWLRRMPGANE